MALPNLAIEHERLALLPDERADVLAVGAQQIDLTSDEGHDFACSISLDSGLGTA